VHKLFQLRKKEKPTILLMEIAHDGSPWPIRLLRKGATTIFKALFKDVEV